MLKEFLEALSEQAVEAAGPQISNVNPTEFYVIRRPDGTVENFGGAPMPRKHEARDLETVVSFAERFVKTSAIWYSRASIICLTDDETRRDRVTVPMIHSDQIKKLAELEKAKPFFDQRSFLFMLRTVFTQAALPKYPSLIDVLRKVNFVAGSATDSNIQRGKASVDKSLQAEAKFTAEVPETIILDVPIFDNSFGRKTQEVNCALEIYEAEQKFQLFPLPGEIESAYASAESEICQALIDLLGKDAKTPVCYGAP